MSRTKVIPTVLTALAMTLLLGVGGVRAQNAALLPFDPTGADYRLLAVEAGQVIELTKFDGSMPPDEHAGGDATVTDLVEMTDYVVPDGTETCKTPVIDPAGQRNVPLVFIGRSAEEILQVVANTAPPTSPVPPCQVLGGN